MHDLSTRIREFAISQRHEAARLRERAAGLAGEIPGRAARAVAAGELAGLGPAANAAGARMMNAEALAEIDKLTAAATACDQRAAVAERDPPGMLVRGEVEHRDANFLARWRSLVIDARKAGWVLEELPDDMKPPPPPKLEPSPSAGWSADKKVLRVWKESYSPYSRDVLKAMEIGARVEVIG
jgi:hypothetical protein